MSFLLTIFSHPSYTVPLSNSDLLFTSRRLAFLVSTVMLVTACISKLHNFSAYLLFSSFQEESFTVHLFIHFYVTTYFLLHLVRLSLLSPRQYHIYRLRFPVFNFPKVVLYSYFFPSSYLWFHLRTSLFHCLLRITFNSSHFCVRVFRLLSFHHHTSQIKVVFQFFWVTIIFFLLTSRRFRLLFSNSTICLYFYDGATLVSSVSIHFADQSCISHSYVRGSFNFHLASSVI